MENTIPIDLSSSSTENLAKISSFLIPSRRPHSSLFEPLSDISNKLTVPRIKVDTPDLVSTNPELPLLPNIHSSNVKSAAATGNGTAVGSRCATTPFYCEDCNMHFSSSVSMFQHKEGKRHRYAVSSMIKKTESTSKKRRAEFFCDICSLEFPNEAMLKSHSSGRKHLARVALLNIRDELQQSQISTNCSPRDESVSSPPPLFISSSDTALLSTHTDVDENFVNPVPSSLYSAPSEISSPEAKNEKLVGLLQHLCITQILSLIGFPERLQSFSNTKIDLDQLISLVHSRCNEICMEGFSQANQQSSSVNKEHKSIETSESLLLLCWCQQLISLSGIGLPSN